MNRRLLPVSTVILGCLSVLMGACDVQDPDRYVRAPVIKSYSPKALSISALVGDSLFFSIAAEDPQGQNLSYRFMLGDSAASVDAEWDYVVEDTGYVGIRGCVSNGVSESVIEWQLMRSPAVNNPPEIVDVFPPQPNVTAIVGDALEFVVEAIDADGDSLSYAYTIGDVIVGATRRFTYESTVVGVFAIRALVSDGESFVSHTWTLHVAAEPDSVPPARVVVVSIGPGAQAGEVDVEWVAVGDDSMTGLPAYYVVRTSPVAIEDEHGWTSASDRDGEPQPAEPGQIMRMTVRNLPPANTVFVAVRAVDDFGLISPLSALASTRVRGMRVFGVVRDAVTEEPLEGVRVRLVSAADTTDADGSFALVELPVGVGFITIEDDPWRTEIGEYFDLLISPYTIRDKEFLNLWMLPNISLETLLYDHFLDFYTLMTALDGCPQDVLGRWDIPCKVFVPALVKGGLDYRQTIQDAFLEWERLIGLDVVEFVEAVPDTGLFVTYDYVSRDLYIITKRGLDCLPIQGQINFRSVYSASPDSVLSLVARHEVGHSLRLNHSMDDIHIMYSSPYIMHPSQDEVRLLRAVYRLPRGFPERWLIED